MTKKLTVQIAEVGNFVGSSRDNKPIKEVIEREDLNQIRLNFLGSVPVNIEHEKNNIVGKCENLYLSGNKLIGTIIIDFDDYDLIKNKYISPEFILNNKKPVRLLALGIVKNPAISNAKIL